MQILVIHQDFMPQYHMKRDVILIHVDIIVLGSIIYIYFFNQGIGLETCVV